MSEATFVISVFIFRVFLVGGILFVLPRIARKGLLFGVHVGGDLADGDAARGVLRSWDRGCLVVMAIALLVGLAISATGHPLTGNLTGTAVLLLAGFVLYVRTYSMAHVLAPPVAARQAERATAALLPGSPQSEALAKLTLAVCLIVGLATFVYAAASNEAGDVTDLSILAVLYAPAWNLVLGSLFALLALMMATAKRSLREGPGSRSVEAQEAFRSAMANITSGTALLFCALLTLVSVQVVRIGFPEAFETLDSGILVVAVLMILYLGGNLIRIMKRFGQGGALLERGSDEGELTGGLADNAQWILGLFYLDRDDPSVMVEDRFGLGYTLNWGNPIAALFGSSFMSLIFTLAVLGFFL